MKANNKGPLEKVIQQAIVAYLQIQENLGKLVYIRNNSFAGKIMRSNGAVGFVKNNKPGASDIIVFIPDTVIFLEIKREVGMQSIEQKEFQRKVEKLGYYYAIARSLDDLLSILRDLNYNI